MTAATIMERVDLIVTLCLLGNLDAFLMSTDFFSKSNFFTQPECITGSIVLSVTCLATDACLTADPGVPSSISPVPYFCEG